MRIKICGITNLEDARNAIEAGAHALGFVFYEKSPRYIKPQIAKEIITQLPPFVQSVGLFVNEIPAKIDFIVRKTRIDIVQTHFSIDERFKKHLQSKYIEVIRAKKKQDILNLDPNKYYLVDAFVESYGGEGKRIALDWFDEVDCSKIIIAGGLTSENLLELKGYNFYGVDVSSGVELSKGKKDKQKIIDFINKAHELSQ